MPHLSVRHQVVHVTGQQALPARRHLLVDRWQILLVHALQSKPLLSEQYSCMTPRPQDHAGSDIECAFAVSEWWRLLEEEAPPRRRRRADGRPIRMSARPPVTDRGGTLRSREKMRVAIVVFPCCRRGVNNDNPQSVVRTTVLAAADHDQY